MVVGRGRAPGGMVGIGCELDAGLDDEGRTREGEILGDGPPRDVVFFGNGSVSILLSAFDLILRSVFQLARMRTLTLRCPTLKGDCSSSTMPANMPDSSIFFLMPVT